VCMHVCGNEEANTRTLGMWASKYILFVNFFFVMVLPIWATPGLG
jgi:hypothetical protein